jgi:pimeloyl-ACP methyl ester carboxylesterase
VLLAFSVFAALKPEIAKAQILKPELLTPGFVKPVLLKPELLKPKIVKAVIERSPRGDRSEQSAVARAESIPGCPARQPLIVVGFMGGHVHSDNLAHGEARLARDLDDHYPGRVDARTFENRREHEALGTVVKLLDTSKDGRLSEAEKSSARIVIFGHSWGASETVHFARELNRRGIPVLLTVQVDSVQKSGQDDQNIPPNVREAVNFYQKEGLLHGRASIRAMDPGRTTILGSYESSYRKHAVSCRGYGWFARAFMRPHIEIENDRAVWNRIEALILARSCAPDSALPVVSISGK